MKSENIDYTIAISEDENVMVSSTVSNFPETIEEYDSISAKSAFERVSSLLVSTLRSKILAGITSAFEAELVDENGKPIRRAGNWEYSEKMKGEVYRGSEQPASYLARLLRDGVIDADSLEAKSNEIAEAISIEDLLKNTRERGQTSERLLAVPEGIAASIRALSDEKLATAVCKVKEMCETYGVRISASRIEVLDDIDAENDEWLSVYYSVFKSAMKARDNADFGIPTGTRTRRSK